MRRFLLVIGICLVQHVSFATTDMEKVFQNQHLKSVFNLKMRGTWTIRQNTQEI